MSTSTAMPRPVGRLSVSPFAPISDYAFLSDCHTGALLGPDGSIDWLCVPRFDSPSIFAAILDRQAGFFRFGPYGIHHPTTRIYVPGTNIVQTIWKTPTSWLQVDDALTIGPGTGEDPVTPHSRPPTDGDAHHTLVRVVQCLFGTAEVDLVCEPRHDFGRTAAAWSVSADRHSADGVFDGLTVRLSSDLHFGNEGDRLRARHRLNTGDKAFCALTWSEGLAAPATVEEAEEMLRQTTAYWRTWLSNARIPDHRYRDPIQRSALIMKGLTYMPTGAMVAAATTSLPEALGGERNWDYRYTWMRDTGLTLRALHSLQLDWEADEFVQFIADLERAEDGSLQIMYGIDGRRDLTESVRTDLSGYEGSQPVRVGNGAFRQHQHDASGAVLDAILLHTNRTQRVPLRLWPIVKSQAEHAARVWREPDQGIWEARGEPRHYVSSKVMCWVALDRAAEIAHIAGRYGMAEDWRAAAAEIKTEILARGISERGVLRQHYDTDALDASSLLAILYGFLPPDDDRMVATVLAVAGELTENGYVLRYRVEETPDGLVGTEGTFLICSFWLVTALAVVGEIERARAMMEKLLRIGSGLGLYAEEFNPHTAQHLGNFPQAFSHLALIEAAFRIIAAEEG